MKNLYRMFDYLHLRIVLLALVALGVITAEARDVEQAKQAALQQMRKVAADGAEPGRNAAIALEPRLVYSQAKTQDETYYYVFSAGENTGYTVVSGDDRLPAIIGYSDKGTFDARHLPEAFVGFMEAYQEFVDNASDEQIEEVMAWKTRANHQAVAPFLTSTWNQMAPYNNMCPTYQTGQRSATGCVATAIAQILYYWKTPVSLMERIPAYRSSSYGCLLRAVNKGETYDWDNMLDNYDGSETAEQQNAVAKLMLHVGCAVQMDYGPSSGAHVDAEAFTKFFGMDKELTQYLWRASYKIDKWDQMLYGEMAAKRPVYYAGQSTGGGHAFVIQGYQDGLYYVNWGWGGYCDGYFDITLLNPDSNVGTGASSSSDGYSASNEMIIGIQPDNGVEDKVATSMLYYILDKSSCLTNLTMADGHVKASATYGTVSFSNVPVSRYVSMGYINEDGDIVNVGTPQKMNYPGMNSDGTAYVYNVTTAIDFAAANGKTYELAPIESADAEVWALSSFHSSGDDYVAVKVNGNMASVVDLKSVLSAAVALDSNSEGYAGMDNTINVTLSNSGDKEYYDVVTAIIKDPAGNSFQYATGVTVPVAGSTTFNFAYTSTAGGTCNVSVVDANKNVVYSGTIDFRDAPPAPVLSFERIACTSETTGKDYGLFQGGKVQMDVVDGTKADFEFTIRNEGGYYKGRYYIGYLKNGEWSLEPHQLTLPANSVQTFTFTVENHAAGTVGVRILNAGSAEISGLKEPNIHYLEGGNEHYAFKDCELVYLTGKNTGISDAMGNGEDDGVYYDLRGQRVTNPAKGVYIKNGKKYLFK